jgi:hypothetical protein
MMNDNDDHGIAAELLDSGSLLWSSVECDVKQNCVVVYARLYTHSRVDIEGALAESERLLKSVIERRLAGQKSWVAAVQWSDRLCKTFMPSPDAATNAATRS